MAAFALPIKEDYVAHWGVWECVREFIQNAKDEEYQRDNPMEVTYKPGSRRLIILNKGAQMGREALLLGETSKRSDAGARGQFGEGLDLALLVGVRCGLDIIVETHDERWSPAIEPRKEFQGRRCLVVHTRKLKNRRNHVRVSIQLEEGMWPQLRKRFLFLQEPKDSVETPHGTLLAGEGYKGLVYVKGIYVCTKDKLQFGYDFDHMELDRDRRAVADWQIEWKAAEILQIAAEKSTKGDDGRNKIQETVWSMLADGGIETKDLPEKVVGNAKLLASFVDTFKLRHGDDAIPVSNMSESQQLDHYGERGVVVSDQLVSMLSHHYGTFASRMKERRFEPLKTFAWSDLTKSEQLIIKEASGIVDGAVTTLYGATSQEHTCMANLEIVEWSDENLHGTCNLGSGHMRLRRKELETVGGCVATLIHEMAHGITEAADGTKDHVMTIEKLWQATFEELRACTA